MADNKRKLIVTDEAVLAVLIQLEKDGEIEMTGEAGLAEGGDFRATDKLLKAGSPVDAGVDEDEEDHVLDKSCTLCMETMPGTAHEKYVHVCAKCTSGTTLEDVLQAPDMPKSCPHHDKAVANCSCCHAGVVRMRTEAAPPVEIA